MNIDLFLYFIVLAITAFVVIDAIIFSINEHLKRNRKR